MKYCQKEISRIELEIKHNNVALNMLIEKRDEIEDDMRNINKRNLELEKEKLKLLKKEYEKEM